MLDETVTGQGKTVLCTQLGRIWSVGGYIVSSWSHSIAQGHCIASTKVLIRTCLSFLTCHDAKSCDECIKAAWYLSKQLLLIIMHMSCHWSPMLGNCTPSQTFYCPEDSNLFLPLSTPQACPPLSLCLQNSTLASCVWRLHRKVQQREHWGSAVV